MYYYVRTTSELTYTYYNSILIIGLQSVWQYVRQRARKNIRKEKGKGKKYGGTGRTAVVEWTSERIEIRSRALGRPSSPSTSCGWWGGRPAISAWSVV